MDSDKEPVEVIVIEEPLPEGVNPEDVEMSRMDEFQHSLPPLLASLVGELRNSFNERKKEYLIGIGAVIGFLIVLGFCSILLLGYFTKDEEASSEDLIFEGTTESFLIGPITVPYTDRYFGSFFNIDKPSGNIHLHEIDITIVDEEGNTIPLSVVYNHHITIINQDNGVFIGGIGAESADVPGLKLLEPYVEPVDSSDNWVLNAELLNIWGAAAQADIDIFIRYDIIYTDVSSDNIPVAWSVIGDTENLQNVTKNCKNYSDDTCRFDYEFDWNLGDSTIVSVVGHIHIGSINITLTDMSNNRDLATAIPLYDDTGNYILSIDTTADIFEITDGTKLKITSYYSTEYTFNNVMSLFQIWGTFDSYPIYSESELEYRYENS